MKGCIMDNTFLERIEKETRQANTQESLDQLLRETREKQSEILDKYGVEDDKPTRDELMDFSFEVKQLSRAIVSKKTQIAKVKISQRRNN